MSSHLHTPVFDEVRHDRHHDGTANEEKGDKPRQWVIFTIIFYALITLLNYYLPLICLQSVVGR